ncbi:related to EDE1 protein [Rhynchosporium secalis]|uniref:Related to EDE1 protein n=1 Tax=Rhynchosporium secalis TaxID=38038 RepID=A0A1E1LZB9_RHYSE|nr:related to EDE1 protein [Rhynchosporium secalis]
MAEDPTAPSLNLTAEEKRVFGQLFREADSENIGVVTGEVAVKFFEKTRLEPRILGEIWQIADKENRGLLTPAGFGIVLRLIGHYQAGRDPTPDLALRPGPLPKFDGGSAPGMSPSIQPPPGPPPSVIQPQGSGSGPIRVPPLTPEKAAQYAGLFERSGAQNGVLPGELAKSIFERAGLPNDVLGRIWNLADTEQKGSLQVTEFVIAMHLLASFKAGALRALPNLLPAGLYEAAARRPSSRPSSTVVGGAMSAIPRQFSGAGAARTGSPLSRPAYVAPPQQYPQISGPIGEWAITPSDKQKFDGIYNNLDRANKGYITGDEAVPFFSESKLPEEALAQIWDLADINSAGHLTRDEFAVAMYLIRQQRGKRDGRDSLPNALPQNLIPPSMRNQAHPAPLPTAPVFDDAPPPSMQKSAADDLFGLDALSSPGPAPASAQVPLSTGGSGSFGVNRQLDNDPFGSRGPMTPTSPIANSPQQQNVFKPFAPSSSFGQSLNYQGTGGSNNSGPSQQRSFQSQQSGAEDLLGDNDPEISKRLTNETSELANLSNQVGMLSKQMQDVQGQRVASQNELNQATSQKREFETRLTQLRNLYEKEVKDVRSLQERLTASRNETKKLQTEIAMIEGTQSDLRTQHQQISTALQADQQENASLKERMKDINAEIAQLKLVLEKLRSDARQQKGLVAINRKQLATNEGEREKLKTEADELNKSIEEDTKSHASAPRAHSQVQSPAPVASPALSTMSANNPFFRRQGSSVDMTNSQYAASPGANQQGDRSFENVFGPSFGGAAAAGGTEAPPTSFRQDSTRSPSISSASAFPPIRSQTTGGSGFGSQTSSPPQTANRELPSTNIPPPPPESRQISSSFLPFPSHVDSITSSKQVSAPNSRSGDGFTGADTPTNYMVTTPAGSSAAGPSENARAVSPSVEGNNNPALPVTDHKDPIPGAFPGDANSTIAATPTGGSTLSDATTDPFTMIKAPERTGTAKDDFDSAFAGFGGAAKKQERSNTGNSSASGSVAAAPAGFNKEFPPIAELADDDDSDSNSEGGGFDDDFAPASPGHARKISGSQAPAPNGGNDMLAARPIATQQSSALSIGTGPPTPGAQASPPAYDKTVSSTDQAHVEAQQYMGLLPSREVLTPTSASPDQTSGPLSTGQSPFGIASTSAQPVAPPKIPFDDDFDEFDGLEDAKEGDADDEFANISAHDRSGLDDFNPMFDNPPQSKDQELNQHVAQSSNGPEGSNNAFGGFTQSASTTQPTVTDPPVNDNQDWDAIFAGLDDAPPVATDAPKVTEISKPLGNGTSTSSPTTSRPALGRALTEAGVHDDPILKNLTGMGYPRNDALAALEKYDYNLERAANYLASQS